MINILGFAGSTRTASFHKRLVRVALGGAEQAGAQVRFIDLRDLDIPLYDGDLEAGSGMPDGAREIREALKAADGVLIASPEYNGSLTAVLKNVIDWTSVSDPQAGEEPRMVAWKGKVAGIMSCSPGNLGGLRGLNHLHSILSGIGVHVVPNQVAVPMIHQTMQESGILDKPEVHARVEGLGTEVMQMAQRLREG